MSAEQLTVDLWKLILQELPLSERMRLALTNSKLRDAAAAATDSIRVAVDARSPQRRQQLTQAFEEYLDRWGGQYVTSIVLTWQQAPSRLPCPRLLDLELDGAELLQLPAVLEVATRLTHLKLTACTLAEGVDLSSLSVLVGLENLDVFGVRRHDDNSLVVFPGQAVLPFTPHLTSLRLFSVRGVENVHLVSSLTKLCTLHIQANTPSPLAIGGPPLTLTPSITPSGGWSLPAALRELEIDRDLTQYVVLGPAVLSPATQLTRLCLNFVRVVGGLAGGAALLAAVAALKNLHELELSMCEVEWPPPGDAYTGLIASSSLQKLSVDRCWLPVGVWEQGVFREAAAGQRVLSCPTLRHFSVVEVDGPANAPGARAWNFEAVSRLVRFCPGLAHLSLYVYGILTVAQLAPLTSLTDLELTAVVDEEGCGDTVKSIADLQKLEQLNLAVVLVANDPDEFADVDQEVSFDPSALLPLTQLTSLRHCSVRIMAADVDGGPEEPLLSFTVHSKERPPLTDCGLQVLGEVLEASGCPQAAVAAIVKLVEEHSLMRAEMNMVRNWIRNHHIAVYHAVDQREFTAQNAFQAHQVLVLQQQVARQQAQAAQQDQHIADLQRRLTEQEQQSEAELRRQAASLEALQEQMQQLLLSAQQKQE